LTILSRVRVRVFDPEIDLDIVFESTVWLTGRCNLHDHSISIVGLMVSRLSVARHHL
jgi:hypothetical protein